MGPDTITAAFLYFYYLDKANAQIHLADVRFSPITFELARTLSNAAPDLDEPVSREVGEVMRHVGMYELDHGR
jgi:hypothetical protein